MPKRGARMVGADAGRTHAPVVAESGQADGPNVGANLRLLRLERGLSLVQLAERSGVSRAMLNQIETGRSSPTIALGWKIANGLGVSFGALLGEAAAADFVIHRAKNVASFYSADRSLRSRALFPSGDARTAELYELELAAGSEEKAHSHAPGTREHIYVDRGTLVIDAGGPQAELHEGDVIFFRADRPHRYYNPGKAPTRFFLVMRYPGEPRAPRKV